MRNFFVSLILLIVLGGGLLFVVRQLQKESMGNAELETIKRKGGFVIGTDATYPPMESMDAKKNFIGFDIDLAREIGKVLGVPVEFKNLPFDSLIDRVIEGELDMAISSFSITPERAKKVLFSNPYLNAGQTIITTRTNTSIREYKDLTGKHLAAQKETTSEKEALKVGKKVTNYVSDYASVLEEMKLGIVDALIIDLPAGATIVKEKQEFTIVGAPFTNEFYGIVLSKKNELLKQAVNDALAKIKTSGNLDQLERRWLR